MCLWFSVCEKVLTNVQQANPARLQSAGRPSESSVNCESDVFWQTTGVGWVSASVADWRITQGDSSHSERARCSGTRLHYARLTGAVKMRSDSYQPLLATEWGLCLCLCSVTCVSTYSRLQKQTSATCYVGASVNVPELLRELSAVRNK